MALDLSAASNILKVFYLGPIREQLNNSTVLLSRLDKDETTQDVYGKTFTVPLHITRNTSAGSGRADGGTLPDAGQQGWTTATVPNKYVYGRIQVSGPTIKATRNNAGAFVKAIETEIKGVTRDMKRAINRQLHGDGRDVLAFVNDASLQATSDGTDIFDDGRGNPFTHLFINQKVDWVNASTHAIRTGGAGLFITSLTKSTSGYSVGYSATQGGAGATLPTSGTDNDYLVPASGEVAGFDFDSSVANQYQMMGIAGIIADTNPPWLPLGLHGIPVTNEYWKAQSFGNSGTNRALTFEGMQDPLSEIEVASDYSADDVKFLLSNVYVRDKYYALCRADKRIVNTLKMDGGWSGLEFNGKPIITDNQCQRNRIYYIVPETMKIFRTSDFDWMDEDGEVLSRVANKDAYEATLFHYGDLACMTRNANGLYADITD